MPTLPMLLTTNSVVVALAVEEAMMKALRPGGTEPLLSETANAPNGVEGPTASEPQKRPKSPLVPVYLLCTRAPVASPISYALSAFGLNVPPSANTHRVLPLGLIVIL